MLDDVKSCSHKDRFYPLTISRSLTIDLRCDLRRGKIRKSRDAKVFQDVFMQYLKTADASGCGVILLVKESRHQPIRTKIWLTYLTTIFYEIFENHSRIMERIGAASSYPSNLA